MNIDHYYYIYSAMTQVMGALLALVGVFMIFRIQLQKEYIESHAEKIRKILLNPRDIDAYRLLIDDKETSQEKKDKILIAEFEHNSKLLKTHEKTLENTVKKGKSTVKELAYIFIFYILILHLNALIYCHPLNYLKNIVLTCSLIFVIVIIVRLISFFSYCIHYDLKK